MKHDDHQTSRSDMHTRFSRQLCASTWKKQKLFPLMKNQLPKETWKFTLFARFLSGIISQVKGVGWMCVRAGFSRAICNFLNENEAKNCIFRGVKNYLYIMCIVPKMCCLLQACLCLYILTLLCFACLHHLNERFLKLRFRFCFNICNAIYSSFHLRIIECQPECSDILSFYFIFILVIFLSNGESLSHFLSCSRLFFRSTFFMHIYINFTRIFLYLCSFFILQF